MANVLECKDINELIKLGWSYPIRSTNSSGSSSDITGLYCWKKYLPLKDGNKDFLNFVVSDNEDEYPNEETLNGYYYEQIAQEELAQLMADTDSGSFPVSSIESVQQVDADTISLQISY